MAAWRPAFWHSLDELVKVSGGRLRREGYKFQPLFRTEVAGLGEGIGRVGVTKPKFRKPPGQPMLQLFALAAQHLFQLTVPEAQAEAARNFGPVRIDQAAPPALVPIVWMPVHDWSLFSEQLVLTERGIRLTATITTNPVSLSSDQYAITCLQGRASQLRNMAVNDGRPDTFLGGQYCIRHTSVLGGGIGSAVRSGYLWAGVVAGYGVQITVVGTQTIIDLDRARQLMNCVVLIPPG